MAQRIAALATFLVNRGTDVKTIQGLLRDAKVTTTLDLYSQSIDASKINAQKDMAMAITSNGFGQFTGEV